MTLTLDIYDFLLILLVGSAMLILILVVVRWLLAGISYTVNITIGPASVPLSAISDPLNLTGQVGQPFSASLVSNVQGGKPPYKLTTAGTLPDGITDDGSGNLGGVPTTAGTTTLSVSVSDSAN